MLLCWVLLRDPTRPRADQALLRTDPHLSPATILTWYLHRWHVEVTFQEVCAHLGVQTQRQWSAAAMARATPALRGLFRWLVLVAHRLPRQRVWRPAVPPGYPKPRPTFADVLVCIRHTPWTGDLFFPPPPAQSLDTLCYTA